MGHYFILDRDASFAISLQDALEESGHTAQVFQDPGEALAALTNLGADILVVDLEASDLDERSLIGTFRAVPENRSLSIVGLTERTESQYIVDVLELGVTDVLSKKWPIEELSARLSRTSGQATAELPMLQGRLAGRQLIDFLEYLRHLGKSGILQITSRGGAGRIDIHRGAISSARFRHLHGRSAALALLEQSSGRFRLESADGLETDSARAGTLDLQSLLLRSAWLADKLRQYEPWVPRASHELDLVSTPELSALGELVESLPFPEVIAQAKARRAVRLHDLEHEIDAPPQELRLILAVLVKHGYLDQKLDPESLPPTTQELRSTLGVELSAQALLQRARESGGVHSRLVTLHLLAETDVWPKLRGLFEAFREPPFDAFNVQLAEEQQGRLVL
ncbi:MAG: response regulator, partial [Acidobacteriota bacterium]